MEVGRRGTVVRSPLMQTVRCRRSQAALHSPHASFDIDEAQQRLPHDQSLDSIEFNHGSRYMRKKGIEVQVTTGDITTS